MSVLIADNERIHCSGAPVEEQYHLKQERYQRPEQGEEHRPNSPATDMGQLCNHVAQRVKIVAPTTLQQTIV